MTHNQHTASNPLPVPACRLVLAGAADAGRPALMAYVHRQFATHYGADVTSFMPWLVGVYQDEAVAAVAGFRLARDERLYLEQYLDAPIEAAVAHLPGLAVPRSRIAEIGNLAGSVRPCVRELFVALACLMQAAGVAVVTCTANPAVRAVFREMKMPFRPICTASRERLGGAAAQWGSYYDRTCIIMAVNVQDVIDAMLLHYPDIMTRALPAAAALAAGMRLDCHDPRPH